MFHKVNSVSALPDYEICVRFWDGSTKVYDIKPLFKKWPAFEALKRADGDFEAVKVEAGGYGVSWSDELDLACEELWENGKEIDTPFSGLISFADASTMWQLNESTLRKAVFYGKFQNGIDVCKFGKQWLVSVAAMQREYGKL